jgi:hypothetical protein
VLVPLELHPGDITFMMIVEIPPLRWLGRDKNDLTAAS